LPVFVDACVHGCKCSWWHLFMARRCHVDGTQMARIAFG
jgi:hypothetical protein